MPDSTVLYAAVYTDPGAALADLDAFGRLHEAKVIGKFDAAVIDKEDGEPHIVKRMDHPTIRVIPEWLGSGTLPRHELHDVARSLEGAQAALIVVGEPTLQQGFEKAVTRANRTFKRNMNVAADELARELTEAVKR